MSNLLNKTGILSQNNRPACSVPLHDADLALNNCNWTKGLQSMSDWIWSANLNPVAFPNNLGRFFLHIPGTFEQQLNYSTSLIFDEPSFKNGVQISGFVSRVARELAISTIAQTRCCWYTLTHHAILGKLTAMKHNISDLDYTNRWVNILNHDKFPNYYSKNEHEIIRFAKFFSLNPKDYTDGMFNELKNSFAEYNRSNYQTIEYPMLKQKAAKDAYAQSITTGGAYEAIYKDNLQKIPTSIPQDILDEKINAQVVELAFLCLQFVALSAAFTGLNIPDEDFLPDVINSLLSSELINKINIFCQNGLDGIALNLIPPPITQLKATSTVFSLISKGTITIPPQFVKGTRVPLVPYEGKTPAGNLRPAYTCSTDNDKGLTVGGIQVGVYGWGFGGHFPGSLVYCLMHHPELARFEAPYSLPVLFNEDEWRNGSQTAGFVSRKLKEFVIQKIYRTNRSRYGLEHHIMFFYNSFLDEFGVGRNPNLGYSASQINDAKNKALNAAEQCALYIGDHENAPKGTFNKLELAVLTWTKAILTKPHQAHEFENSVREELTEKNKEEINMGLRNLDMQDKIGFNAAMDRLTDHQICELAMLIGHMDGLGRLLSILKLEAEDAVQIIDGSLNGKTGGINPKLNSDKEVQYTGYFNNRPALHDILKYIGISPKVLTQNELYLNPELCELLESSASPAKTISDYNFKDKAQF